MRAAVIIMSFVLIGCSQREHGKTAAAREREAAIADYYSGKAFVGRDGKKEAQADISRGAPKLFLYGQARADFAERSIMLKERFGITLDALAGCIVSEPLVAFANSYNAEVRQFISMKFGSTALETAESDALALWRKKNEKG